MKKTLDRPETFSKNILKFFSSQIKKEECAMLWVTSFATVSQTAIHCQL